MQDSKSLTFYAVLVTIFLMPLMYFKTYLGPIPISAEVILIPIVTLAAIIDLFMGNMHLNKLTLWPLYIAFGIYFLVDVISLTQAVNVMPGILEIIRFLSYVILFFIITRFDFSKKQYIRFGITFLASVTIVGVFGVLQYVFNFSLNTAGLYALTEAKGRVDSTLINPNYYSAFLNFVIPMALLLAVVYFKDKLPKFLMFALYGILIINLILTYTRAAWVTMACAVILLIILLPKRFVKNIFKPQILISFIILIAIVYFMPDVQQRTNSALYAVQSLLPNGSSTPTDHEEKGQAHENSNVGTDEEVNPDEELDPQEKKERATTNRAVVSRTTLWKTGYYMLRDNPVLGVGAGNYSDRYGEYVHKYPELYIGYEDSYSVHNSYLKVGAETGYLGLLSFLAIYVVYLLLIFIRYVKETTTLGKVLTVGLMVGSICFLVQNLSNNIIFIPQQNVIFWLVGGLTLAFLYKKNIGEE